MSHVYLAAFGAYSIWCASEDGQAHRIPSRQATKAAPPVSLATGFFAEMLAPRRNSTMSSPAHPQMIVLSASARTTDALKVQLLANRPSF